MLVNHRSILEVALLEDEVMQLKSLLALPVKPKMIESQNG
jgi:hypothetical protein